jgi:hypothetical protein
MITRIVVGVVIALIMMAVRSYGGTVTLKRYMPYVNSTSSTSS